MDSDALLPWLDQHFQSMPPVAALHLQPAALEADALVLRAPLASNINDKGCAFGGSLVSLMTLAGWGLMTLGLRSADLSADVFVADTQVRYRAPLYADLHAQARLAPGQDWNQITDQLRRSGRAAADILASIVLPQGGDAVRAKARYVAIAKG